MKKTLVVLAVGLSMWFNSAGAATYDATVSGDGFIFSHSFSGDNNFNDYIAFSTDGLESILGSVSGTGATFSFSEFNLLDQNKNLIVKGTVFNVDEQVSFGFAKSVHQGNYYLQVVGQSTGATAGYTGNITLTSVVPEPESLALLLPGLALLRFKLKRSGDLTAA